MPSVLGQASSISTANYTLVPTCGGGAISVTGASLSPGQPTLHLALGRNFVFGTDYTINP